MTKDIQEVVLYPSRFVQLDQARRLFGDRADQLGALLWEADPLADVDVPEWQPFRFT